MRTSRSRDGIASIRLGFPGKAGSCSSEILWASSGLLRMNQRNRLRKFGSSPTVSLGATATAIIGSNPTMERTLSGTDPPLLIAIRS